MDGCLISPGPVPRRLKTVTLAYFVKNYLAIGV